MTAGGWSSDRNPLPLELNQELPNPRPQRTPLRAPLSRKALDRQAGVSTDFDARVAHGL